MCRFQGLLQKVIALCKNRGFVLESHVETGCNRSHYCYSYGSHGTEMRRNLREEWWRDVVVSKGNVYSLESPSFLQSVDFETENQQVCLADVQGLKNKLQELILGRNTNDTSSVAVASELQKVFDEFLVFPPRRSAVEDLESLFEIIKTIPGIKLPSGFAKSRKHFRTSSGHYILRSSEEEVMSLQFFCDEKKSGQWMNYWRRQRLIWWRKFANNPSHFSLIDKQSDGSTTQIQYDFPWGKDQIESIVHSPALTIPDAQLPFDYSSLQSIQTEASLERGFLAYLLDAYQEKNRADSQGNVSVCKVLHLHPRLAPVKVTVLPQITERTELCEVSQQLATELRRAGINALHAHYELPDDGYVYQDEIGTPYCITILDSTLSNGIVTLRSRNTTLQEFIHISDVVKTIQQHLGM